VTPEAEAVLHWEIGQILRHFAVHLDYEASAGKAPLRLYAVWDGRRSPSVKLSDAAAHAVAQSDRIRLQTEAILQLIKEHDANARAAD